MTNLPVSLLFVFTIFPLVQEAPRPECKEWKECRALALAAAERQEYERFHDLAWRAVQRGPRNDPGLMAILARAMSLSGRPQDALVILQRLAQAGFATDADTSDDFRRVRALPGWPEFAERLQALPPGTPLSTNPELPAEEPPKETSSPEKADPDRRPEADVKKTSPAPGTKAPSEPPKEAAEPAPASLPAEPGAEAENPSADVSLPVVGDATEALRFESAALSAVGLAYDRVSDRFIVGDRAAHKLAVVGAASHRVVNLAGAAANFGTIAALEIDPREGDLWVVSSSSEDGRSTSTLHKLQLISGRVLFAIPAPGEDPVELSDLAVTRRSTVLALDSAGGRLFRLAHGSKTLEVAATIDAPEPAAIAPTSEAIVYVAHRDGLTRIDLASGASRAIQPAKDVRLDGIGWMRWHEGHLIAVQRDGELWRIARIRISRDGRRAVALHVLDRDVPMAAPDAADLSGDTVYYLAGAASSSGDASETAIRQVTVAR